MIFEPLGPTPRPPLVSYCAGLVWEICHWENIIARPVRRIEFCSLFIAMTPRLALKLLKIYFY